MEIWGLNLYLFSWEYGCNSFATEDAEIKWSSPTPLEKVICKIALTIKK